MWPFPPDSVYIYIHIYTQSLVRIMGGNSSLDHLHNKLRYFLPSIKLSYREFREHFDFFYKVIILSIVSPFVFISWEEQKKLEACLASKQENSLSVVSQYWDRGEATADGSMNDKLVTRSKVALLFQSFSQFFRFSNNHPIIYIYISPSFIFIKFIFSSSSFKLEW